MQIKKVHEEAGELLDAIVKNEGADRELDEYWDLVQATEGVGRKLCEKHGAGHFMLSQLKVIEKNQARGYYE